jgi:hypothetical protein
MTAEQPRATHAGHCDCSQGRALVALARTMLDTIVRCHEAILQDDGETLTVICHVLKQVRTISPEMNLCFQSTAELENNVKALLAFVVQRHDEPLAERSLNAHFTTLRSTDRAPGNHCGQQSEATIANWFFALSQELNAAHPQAAQMLRLRLLGLDRRQIAERLQLPPRLVRHVFHTIGSGRVLSQVDAGAAL